MEWVVIDSKAITPRFDQLAKYINTMSRQGWELRFVDSNILYFCKEKKDG